MEKDPHLLEQKAYELLAQEELSEAFVLYRQAADIYKTKGNRRQAALCYASAASCWSKKSGEKAFYNAALSYETAAQEAAGCGDLEYAAMLYKHAAINYERDLEFTNFSDCFYLSKECYRRFLNLRLLNPRKVQSITNRKDERGWKGVMWRFFTWLALNFSCFIWGHGERPLRAFSCGISTVLLAAVGYTQGQLLGQGSLFKPDFLDALYFSLITFSTVGYGDVTPLGWTKAIAAVEALCGIFIIPLFIVSLSRKYLRV